MKISKQFKSFALGVSLVISATAFGQTTGKAFINGAETSVINFDAKEYKVEFPVSAEAIKGAHMINRIKNFPYVVNVYLEGEGNCSKDPIAYFKGNCKESGLTKLAKSNGSITHIIDGTELNDDIERALNNCGWPNVKVVIKLSVSDKAMDEMEISKIAGLSIPAGAAAKNQEKVDKEIYDHFKSGHAARTVRITELEKGVQSYMQNKWDYNVTTVHITSVKYTNLAATNFDVEGYYIKRANNECKYNSFYGKGVKQSTKYYINWFNSMTAPKPLKCSIADKFKNL